MVKHLEMASHRTKLGKQPIQWKGPEFNQTTSVLHLNAHFNIIAVAVTM
jgi:hypothetical protein